MNSIIHLLESGSLARLGVTLIHSLWQIALLALLFKIALTAAKPRAARLRYWTAITFLLAAIIAPAITFSFLPDRFAVVESHTRDMVMSGEFDYENTATALPLRPQVLLPSPPEPLAANYPSREIDKASSTKPLATATPVWEAVLTRLNSAALSCSPYATLLWFVGVLLFSFRPFTSLVRIFRMKTNGLTRLDEKFTRQVEQLSQRLNLKRSVAIAKSTLVQVPTVVGFFKPLILLPASSLSGLTAAELEAILLHELAHLKRYDDVFVLFQSLVETLLFFHPAVWWFSSVARDERENCCDDLATNTIGSPAPLASALLSLARQNNLSTQALSATGGDVIQRIRRLATVTPAKTGASRWLSSLLSLLVIALLGGYASAVNSSSIATTAPVSMNEPLVVAPSAKKPRPKFSKAQPMNEKILDTWNRIQEARASKLDSPNLMNPPATETMIEHLETVLGYSVPPQVRDSLLIHNGMNNWGLEIQHTEHVEQYFTPLSVQAIEQRWLDDRRYQKEAEAEGDDYAKKPEWIPIFVEPAEGEEQVYLDSTDGTVLHHYMCASDEIDSFRYPDYATFLSVFEHHIRNNLWFEWGNGIEEKPFDTEPKLTLSEQGIDQLKAASKQNVSVKFSDGTIVSVNKNDADATINSILDALKPVTYVRWPAVQKPQYELMFQIGSESYRIAIRINDLDSSLLDYSIIGKNDQNFQQSGGNPERLMQILNAIEH